MGLGTCWIANFNTESARSVLRLPEKAEPIIFTPLGYPADQPGIKICKPLSELVRHEHWQKINPVMRKKHTLINPQIWNIMDSYASGRSKQNLRSAYSGLDSWLGHLFMDEKKLSLIHLLIARLERISADSFWAHRASGVKGSLLRMLEKSEKRLPIQPFELNRIMDLGFSILEKAAKEK